MPKKPQDREHVFVSKVKAEGRHRVAENLYLQVDGKGNKSWLFRYTLHGKPRKMGLGSLAKVTLKKAREEAASCRDMVGAGIDPLTARKEEMASAKVAKALANAKGKTFKWCAEAYIKAHKDGWRNAKHIWQWSNSLEKFVYPVIGDLPVQAVDVALITDVLEPIWKTKNETATRVRGRIESILDWARVREYRQGENPARWRGHLENLLAKPSKIHKVRHYPSLPYVEINDFLNSITEEEGTATKALQMVIYTVTRSSETIKARWDEFDLKQKVWTIPADRTKTEKEHRVPLSRPVLDILEDMKKKRINEYVFPGHNLRDHLSNMAMLALIRRMNKVHKKARWVDEDTKKPIVAHGFRSSFRDWAAEQTNFPREVAEAALAHTVKNKVEAAYLRTDHFEKRKRLMDEWARYCAMPQPKEGSGNNVSKMARRN